MESWVGGAMGQEGQGRTRIANFGLRISNWRNQQRRRRGKGREGHEDEGQGESEERAASNEGREPRAAGGKGAAEQGGTPIANFARLPAGQGLRISDWKDRRRSKHDEAGQGGKGVEALRRGARGDGERGSGCHHVLTRASRTASVQRLARTPGRVRDD